ncbi:hypothetical protein G7054_g3108 [Neopestalotiopsis clavispora]|nr:hypothetical protein G7054_g3108 [Neopestalotiopsis clavispora]
MGKKSTYSTVSVSSIEYDTDYSGTPLQQELDLGHQHAHSAYQSSETQWSSLPSLYEAKHIPADKDITTACTIPIADIGDKMHEPPGYERVAMLSNQSTGHIYSPAKTVHDFEEPKAALTRSRCPLRSFVHLLALATTIPVLWLNFSNKYWADETNWRKRWFLFNMDQQDSFNALQFAAKIHEIFVAASVSAMIMHIVRRKLVGRNGLPFGLVVGAYQIGSAEYFISKSFRIPFWRSMRQKCRWNAVPIVILIAMSIVYVNMIGPASAALLIPTLDWFPVKDPFKGLPLTTYFMPNGPNIITDNGLYPQIFNVSDTPWVECTNTSVRTHQFCPGGGYDQLDAWFSSWAWSGLQYDPLIDVFLGKMKRPVVSRITGGSESEPGIAVASTIHTQIARMLDLFSQYVDLNSLGIINDIQRPKYTVSHETPIFSPVVQVQCNGIDQRTALENLQRGFNMSFATNLMQNFSKEQNAYKSGTWQVPTDLWSGADASTDIVDFTWIPTSLIRGADGDLGTLDASIAALARVPVAIEVTWANGTKTMEQDSLVVSCMFDARWATTAVSYDPKQDSTAGFNLTDPLKLFNENTGSIASDLGVSDTIVLDTDWADLLNAPQVVANDTVSEEYPAITLLLSRFVADLTVDENHVYSNFFAIRSNSDRDALYANITNTIEVLLSTLVADGISRANDLGFLLFLELSKESNGIVTIDDILRQAGSWDVVPNTNYSVSNLEDLNHIEFTVERYGWGYGLRPPTAKFAVAILLAYLVGRFLFLVLCLVFRCRSRGWTSQAWGDVGELVALAAMSRESEALQNTGAGIDKKATWMTPVRVRERESSRVEIVFGDAERDSMEAQGLLKVGKKYH